MQQEVMPDHSGENLVDGLVVPSGFVPSTLPPWATDECGKVSRFK